MSPDLPSPLKYIEAGGESGSLGAIISRGLARRYSSTKYGFRAPNQRRRRAKPSPSPLNGERAGVRGETEDWPTKATRLMQATGAVGAIELDNGEVELIYGGRPDSTIQRFNDSTPPQ